VTNVHSLTGELDQALVFGNRAQGTLKPREFPRSGTFWIAARYTLPVLAKTAQEGWDHRESCRAVRASSS
jgi:hypothetical protein